MICFPFAGGGAQSYSGWSTLMPEGIEVVAVKLPGREARMRETPVRDARSLVDEMLGEVQDYLDIPFVLYGHSLGALLAYEFARRLRDTSLAPECLVVSARVPPHRRPPRESIHALPQDQFVEALRRMDGTPAEVLQDAGLMALVSPMLRADLAMNDEYVHADEPLLDCNIVAFGGLDDPDAGRGAMQAWGELTHGDFSMRMVPGGHFFIRSAPALFLRLLSIEIFEQTRSARSMARRTPPSLTASHYPTGLQP